MGQSRGLRLWHVGGDEGGCAEDVEHVLGGWHQDGVALLHIHAVDVGFAP